jgi:hypothetical protein
MPLAGAYHSGSMAIANAALHVKVLGVLYLLFSIVGILASLLLFGVAGGLASLPALFDLSGSGFLLPILGAVGAGIGLLVLLLSLPGLLAGIGLLQVRPWARTLTIVLSALQILNFPFGTALGVYGLIILLDKSGEALFRTGSRA